MEDGHDEELVVGDRRTDGFAGALLGDDRRAGVQRSLKQGNNRNPLSDK